MCPSRSSSTTNRKPLARSRRSSRNVRPPTRVLSGLAALIAATVLILSARDEEAGSSLLSLPFVSARVAYPTGCANQPPSYYDYDDGFGTCPPPELVRRRDDFRLLRRLGAGKFSDVFEAVDEGRVRVVRRNNVVGDGDDGYGDDDVVDPRSLVVVKCLKPVSERKIRRELLVLSHASDLPNLARLLGVCWQRKNGSGDSATAADPTHTPALILEHAGQRSRWLCHGAGCDARSGSSSQLTLDPDEGVAELDDAEDLTEYEIKYFLYHLLLGLDALHSRGIMHRDVKPRNVLITRGARVAPPPPPPRQQREAAKHHPRADDGYGDGEDHCVRGRRRSRSLMIIDLGLADFYLPGQRYNVRVASRHYKAPELLVGHELYDYSLDLWSVGCILAGLLFRREPFFRGRDNTDQLAKIASVLGTPDLLKYCEKFHVKLNPDIRKAAAGGHSRRRSWASLCAPGNPVPSRQALDLLDGLLVYDHTQRLTAAEAMSHAFFDDVRDEIAKEMNDGLR